MSDKGYVMTEHMAAMTPAGIIKLRKELMYATSRRMKECMKWNLLVQRWCRRGTKLKNPHMRELVNISMNIDHWQKLVKKNVNAIGRLLKGWP